MVLFRKPFAGYFAQRVSKRLVVVPGESVVKAQTKTLPNQTLRMDWIMIFQTLMSYLIAMKTGQNAWNEKFH